MPLNSLFLSIFFSFDLFQDWRRGFTLLSLSYLFRMVSHSPLISNLHAHSFRLEPASPGSRHLFFLLFIGVVSDLFFFVHWRGRFPLFPPSFSRLAGSAALSFPFLSLLPVPPPCKKVLLVNFLFWSVCRKVCFYSLGVTL